MMRTLFLQAPSFEGFDGGAGSRYQARREIRSFWYPTWLAQPAALVEGSKLVDAPPHGIKLDALAATARDFDLVVLHTSAPSFAADVKAIEALKAVNPELKAGFIGAKVAVDPSGSLSASKLVDFVAGNEFDFTIKEVAEGRPWDRIAGLSYRNDAGRIVHNDARAILENMDALPFVTPVYKRDLKIENYFIGYLKHPYLSLYTGRGCKSRCTFCLWPQTVGGHRYRTRSVGHVVEEIAWAQKAFPQVKEFFFDDDTFTDDLPRAEAIARELGKLGVTWSCNAKANVPRETLEVLRDNGLRLLLVGYETGNQQILFNIKKGMRIEFARRFTKDCHELGITIHGTFILGLPGRNPGDDRADDTLCHRDQSAHDPGVAGRALPWHAPLSPGARERLARQRQCRAGRRARRADRAAALSAFEPHGNIRFGRDVLQALLFPQRQDRVDRRRDGAQPGNDEAPAARGHRVLPFPARAARGCALKALIVTADDFGLAPEINEAVELAHTKGILTAASLMVGGAAVGDAVARARRLPSLRVGLHLVLVDGLPVLPPEAIPDLLDAHGRLRGEVTAGRGGHVPAAPRAAAGRRGDRGAVPRLSGDGARAGPRQCPPPFSGPSGGRRPGARHRRALRPARACACPGSHRGCWRTSTRTSGYRRDWVTAPWTALLRRRVRRRGLTAPDRVFGLAWSGAMIEPRIDGILRRLPDGLTEIYAHPATAAGFPGAAAGYRYADELAALTAPAIQELLRAAGVRSGGYSDFARR